MAQSTKNAGSAEPVNGINKDMSGANDCLDLSRGMSLFLSLTEEQHCCLCPNGISCLRLPTHPLLHAIRDIIVVKKVAQNPAVLATWHK